MHQTQFHGVYGSVWWRIIFLHVCVVNYGPSGAFLNVTLCLKDSLMMKVEELSPGHRGAMTNSWCHGLIERLWRWGGLAEPHDCRPVTGLERRAGRPPLDTLMLVASEAPPEIYRCDVEQQEVESHGESPLSSPGSTEFMWKNREMFPNCFFMLNVSGTNSWKADSHRKSDLYLHLQCNLSSLKQ